MARGSAAARSRRRSEAAAADEKNGGGTHLGLPSSRTCPGRSASAPCSPARAWETPAPRGRGLGTWRAAGPSLDPSAPVQLTRGLARRRALSPRAAGFLRPAETPAAALRRTSRHDVPAPRRKLPGSREGFSLGCWGCFLFRGCWGGVPGCVLLLAAHVAPVLSPLHGVRVKDRRGTRVQGQLGSAPPRESQQEQRPANPRAPCPPLRPRGGKKHPGKVWAQVGGSSAGPGPAGPACAPLLHWSQG